MSVAGERYFPCVPLGATGADEPHPWMITDVLAVRGNKYLRSLASRAAQQLRHLIDVGALESFLARAALVAMEGGDPAVWLEAQIDAIKEEQAATRMEHARMSSRAAEVTA